MKIYSTFGAAILSALSIQVVAGTIAIQELATTDKEGYFAVCFNGAGALLPCADGVEPPPVDDPYIGTWSGPMIFDRGYTGEDVCHDADVTLRIDPDGNYGEIVSITFTRDVEGVDLYAPYDAHLSSDGYVVNDFKAFGMWTDYSLQFNTHGYAEGIWSNSFDDCRGTWSFTKD